MYNLKGKIIDTNLKELYSTDLNLNNKEKIISINHYTANTYINQPIQSNIIFILGLDIYIHFIQK